MKRPLLARILPVLLLAAAACTAKNDASVQLQYMCAPADDATTCAPAGGTCDRFVTGPGPGGPFVYLQINDTFSGARDNGFYAFMQVANQRPNNADPSSGQLNTADAVIDTYELSYSAPGYALPSYNVTPIEQTIPAAGSLTPYVGLIPFEVSPAFQAALPAAGTVQVLVNVKLKGHFRDGSDWETATWTTPIYVVNDAFPGYGCTPATDVVTAVCPNDGQSASVKCEAP